MNAVISGTAGTALLVDGESLMSFHVDDPSTLVERQQSDLPYLFGEGRDLRIIENADTESIATELKSETDLALALDLTLISLDEELEEDIRKDALQDLDELLVDDHLVVRLENILYARPLPEDGDLVGARKFCADSDPANAPSFLQRLEERQSVIAEVSAAWDAIPTKVLGSRDNHIEFQQVAVREGLFRSFVLVLAKPHQSRMREQTETQANLTTFFLNSSLNPSVKGLRNHRQVMQSWINSFRVRGEAPSIKHEIEEEEIEAAPRRRHGRRIDIDRQAVLREVNEKKEIILGAMKRRDLGLLRHLVDDLVGYQLSSGENQHLAKSLCDLAMEAKELGMFSLQLELTERSIGIAADDGWSWAQHADALLNVQRLDDALRAYEQADAFGAGAVAQTGRAEVLKAQGQFDLALTAFDEVIKQHPENVFAQTGRAEVLKAQGQFDLALTAFDEVIKQHPENVVAQTGRAEVLKAQGQFDLALTAFDEVIKQHPENVVAKNGRAEVLKAQGQFDLALTAFDEVIKQHPENVVAKNGRAEVLKAQGQFDLALTAFDEVIKQHPRDAVAKTGRAEVLKAQGQFDLALTAFDEVIKQHPRDAVAKTGRAEVLKAQGQFDLALTAFDEVIEQHPRDAVAKTGRAEVLKALGELEPALTAYNEISVRFPDDAVARNGRSCILAVLGRYEEALEKLPDKNPVGLQDWIGLHIRGMILMRSGRMDEAAQIFQRGVADNPFPSSAAYFQTALTVALIRQEEYEEASRVLSDIKAPNLQPQIDVLRLHISGEKEQFEEANAAFHDLTPKPWSISDQLLDELHRRYILKAPPKRSNEWVFDQEVGSLLLVANQQASILSYAN